MNIAPFPFLVASLHAQYFEQDDSTDDEYQPLPEDWRKV